MTEYHCWIVIRYHTHDTNRTLQDACVERCEKYIASHPYINDSRYKIVKYNGIETFLASALHNHNDSYIREIFEWVGQNAPGSYGLLYYQDDENAEMLDGFKVYTMKRGKVTSKADSELSPRSPILEDPDDPSRHD